MSQSCYVWGFNGFEQISSLPGGTICQTDGQSTDPGSMCIPTPTQVSPDTPVRKILATWSRLLLITEAGHVHIGGHNAPRLHSQDTGVNNAVSVCGHVILSHVDDTLSLLPGGEATLCRLSCEAFDGTTAVDATDKQLISVDAAGNLHQGDIDYRGTEYHLTLTSVVTGVQVKAVSCGLEHVLLLSTTGSVLSFGRGSRGQLGYGSLTVEEEKTPRVIEMLEGLPVSSVSSGGWHSVALTASGDVYVWGWNESGQLGLPNKSHDRLNQQLSPFNRDIAEERDTESHGSPSLTRGQHWPGFHRTSCERGEEEPAGDKPSDGPTDISECAQDLCDCKKLTDGTSTSQTRGWGDGRTVDQSSTSHGAVVGLLQRTEAVQIQTDPFPLDIPESLSVVKVSCGSRHTAVMLDSGLVLTTGWNGYGQLGHMNTESTDAFHTVMFLLERNLCVTDVFCSAWNTAVLAQCCDTKTQTSH